MGKKQTNKNFLDCGAGGCGEQRDSKFFPETRVRP